MQKCDNQLIFYCQPICFSFAVVKNVVMSIIAFVFKNCFYFFAGPGGSLPPFSNPIPNIMRKIIAYSLLVWLILKVDYCHNSSIHCPCFQVSYIYCKVHQYCKVQTSDNLQTSKAVISINIDIVGKPLTL
jgi:hypothetical protein